MFVPEKEHNILTYSTTITCYYKVKVVIVLFKNSVSYILYDT